MRFVVTLLISLSMGACAEAQQASGQLLIDEKVDKVSAKDVAPIKNPLGLRVGKDYSNMSRAELDADGEKIARKLAMLEVGMDSFDNDDPRVRRHIKWHRLAETVIRAISRLRSGNRPNE